ncbi:A/G-specific adenine glycosylase [Campylobacter sp. TTU-622]|uniref:A/G-specific adenine glycosylase n=1 Tax=Campylobacter sp. TTU-622 TaxID=2800583 RepID=UPI001906CB68|nr:A/G-specific adenine glycosylase [Campylobacter sp. TTU-622]MBK1972469.1 A/G-specific adenine glycosylase [Campylobacter sp. TTU-622]
MQKQTIKKLQENLLIWYEKNGRKELPWRNLQSSLCDKRLCHIERAYGVYISEIMLQQTQVKSVLEKFYFPFLEKFPNLTSLANANEEKLLKVWQGLGYYSRARNLKKAAMACMQKFNGSLPKNIKDLKSLSGIGSYTAGAIACFGYDEKVSFVDSNIKRVLCRLFALESPNMKELELKAEKILNLNNAFDHNQALLDIGALICLPKNPKCGICPIYEFCLGKFNTQLYPQTKKILYENLNLNLVLFEFQKKFSIQKSSKKLYKGLYNFPFFKDDEFNLNENMKPIAEFKHGYTKFKINVKVYHQILDKEDKSYEFKSFKELDNIPISILSLKALKKVKNLL